MIAREHLSILVGEEYRPYDLSLCTEKLSENELI